MAFQVVKKKNPKKNTSVGTLHVYLFSLFLLAQEFCTTLFVKNRVVKFKHALASVLFTSIKHLVIDKHLN